MYLGLDLRGGVHFLLQVDMQGALTGRYDSLASDVRNTLREANIESGNVERADMSVVARFGSADARDNAASELRRSLPDLVLPNNGHRKSVVWGTSLAERVAVGGGR